MRALCRRPTNGKEDVMKVHSKIARMAVASMAAAVVAAPTAGAMPMQGDAAERDMHASTVVQADRGAGDRRGEASIPALRPQTGGQVTTAPAGSFIYLPRDVPHTFLVSSPQARFLLVVEPAGFEGFVREMSEPAGERTLPPATVQPPSPEQMTATAAKYGLDIVGPPGIPA